MCFNVELLCTQEGVSIVELLVRCLFLSYYAPWGISE